MFSGFRFRLHAGFVACTLLCLLMLCGARSTRAQSLPPYTHNAYVNLNQVTHRTTPYSGGYSTHVDIINATGGVSYGSYIEYRIVAFLTSYTTRNQGTIHIDSQFSTSHGASAGNASVYNNYSVTTDFYLDIDNWAYGVVYAFDGPLPAGDAFTSFSYVYMIHATAYWWDNTTTDFDSGADPFTFDL